MPAVALLYTSQTSGEPALSLTRRYWAELTGQLQPAARTGRHPGLLHTVPSILATAHRLYTGPPQQ